MSPRTKRWQYGNDPHVEYAYGTRRHAARILGVHPKSLTAAGYWDPARGQVIGSDAQLIVDWWTA